jgi:hypothetical protein
VLLRRPGKAIAEKARLRSGGIEFIDENGSGAGLRFKNPPVSAAAAVS